MTRKFQNTHFQVHRSRSFRTKLLKTCIFSSKDVLFFEPISRRNQIQRKILQKKHPLRVNFNDLYGSEHKNVENGEKKTHKKVIFRQISLFFDLRDAKYWAES